jgi:hypothetical protein
MMAIFRSGANSAARGRFVGRKGLTSICSGPAHCYPLFLSPLRLRNSRIFAADGLSLADNFLQKQQKQQKQRERGSRPAAIR